MRLRSDSFADGGRIPGGLALASIDPAHHVRLPANRNPHLARSEAPGGTRQGINDCTAWFRGDHDMEGDHCGYDGPCPPWNDALVHRYVFTIHALDIDALPLDGRFTGADVRRAIAGHVRAKASISGSDALNPRFAGQGE